MIKKIRQDIYKWRKVQELKYRWEGSSKSDKMADKFSHRREIKETEVTRMKHGNIP